MVIRVHWIPLPPLSLKINFDGAVFMDSGEVGLGFVVRNHLGVVTTSLLEKVRLPSSLDDVEEMAIIKAISFAIDLNLPFIIIEGVSEVVVTFLRSKDESISSFGHLITSVKQSLDVFHSVTFSHTRKSKNFVTHNLTKHVRHVSSFCVWMKDVPPHLHHVLLANYS